MLDGLVTKRGFGEHTTGAEQQQRSQLLIVGDADDDFHPSRYPFEQTLAEKMSS